LLLPDLGELDPAVGFNRSLPLAERQAADDRELPISRTHDYMGRDPLPPEFIGKYGHILRESPPMEPAEVEELRVVEGYPGTENLHVSDRPLVLP